MANNDPQKLAEFRVMKDIISGGTPEFLTQQDKTMVAYRQANKKVNTNFPIKF